MERKDGIRYYSYTLRGCRSRDYNKTDSHLSLRQLQLLRELHPFGDREVLVLLELGLEGLDLRGGEGGARPLLPVVGRGAAGAAVDMGRVGIV